MIDLNHIKRIYFLGIGGIGMSALARYFYSRGMTVSGYDSVSTSLTRQLEQEGIQVHYEDNIELADRLAQLVVYTPAISREQNEYNFFLKNGYTVLKRSEVLGAITGNTFTMAVAGTHGKTTTTTLLAHLLRSSGYGCNAFLGGISTNYNTNFWKDPKPISVVEADEYDRSFLELSPDIAIITSMDPDHLDIYGSASNMEDAFIAFSHRIKKGGGLISKFGLKRAGEFFGDHQISYHLTEKRASVFAENFRPGEGNYLYDIQANGRKYNDLQLNMGGLHNVENSVAALAVADLLEIDENKIREAIRSFTGVKRRFEYCIPPSSEGGTVMIDDYAHHPEELRALISSVKQLFPDRKCTIVFQPHLFSRTRDLAADFGESLDLADQVLLLPIYPARELPIDGVNSSMIIEKMKKAMRMLITKEDLLCWIGEHKPRLLITAGAGDIENMIEPIKKIMLNRIPIDL